MEHREPFVDMAYLVTVNVVRCRHAELAFQEMSKPSQEPCIPRMAISGEPEAV